MRLRCQVLEADHLFGMNGMITNPDPGAVSDSAVRAEQLHILIYRASINKSVSGFFDILIDCTDIHI